MWTVTLGAAGGVAPSTIAQIQNLTSAAANYWSWYLDDSLADISILLEFEDQGSTTLAVGGTTLFFDGSQGGFDIYEPTSITELNSGTDRNGPSPDITITVNSSEANAGTFYLGPLVDGLSTGAPGKFDLFTILVHEIAHGLGLLTFLDEGGADRTTFDMNVTNSFGSYFFTGSNAVAVFGGNVPLDSSIAHVASSVGPKLFSPTIGAGEVNYISALEIAILADIGAPIRSATSSADRLYGFMTADNISGLSGNDTLIGLAGGDVLNGDGGNDDLRGGAGNDTLIGGDQSDTLTGGAGGDVLDGGGGIDLVVFDDASAGVNVDLNAGIGAGSIANGDTFSQIENILGSAFADTLTGDDVNGNLVDGGGGADSIAGRAGADTLNGGDGDDTISGGDDNDTVSGHAGRDSLLGDAGDDTLHGFGSHDSLYGGDHNDDLRGGYGRDLLNGSNGDDVLRGFEGDDRLFGGGGADTLLGNDDNDVLIGGGGGDRLKGDAGDDTLNGSFGDDWLTGGPGDDLFEYRQSHGADIIDDFTPGASSQDVIRLIAFGAAFDSFAEVMAAASQIGADTVIDFGGGDSITLQNVALASLNPDDFTFG